MDRTDRQQGPAIGFGRSARATQASVLLLCITPLVFLAAVPATAGDWETQATTREHENDRRQLSQSATPARAEERRFDIPAGELQSALLLFSRQVDLQLLYAADLTEGLATEGLEGRFTPEAALRQLLVGSGLTYRFSDAGTVTLARSDTEASDGPMVLEPIVVEGQKIGRSLRETPASVVVIGSEADTARNRESRDALQGIPNLLAEEGPSLPSIRGIDGSAGQIGGAALATGAQPRIPILVDGVPRPLTIGATPSLNSLWDLEVIEVARGPQSTTSGRNSLGGTIRINTKDPTYRHEFATRGSYRTQDETIGGAVMANIPLIEDQLAFRFTAEASDGETFVEITDPNVADFEDEVEEEAFQRFRGKVLMTPKAVDGLEVLFSVDRSEAKRLFQPGLVDGDPDDQELSDFVGITSTDDNTQTVYLGKVYYPLSDNVEFEGQAAFLDNQFLIPNTNPLFDFEQDTDTVAAEALLRFSNLDLVDKGVFGVAFENQEDKATNDVAFFPLDVDAEITNVGIFSEVEVAPSQLAGGDGSQVSVLDGLTFILGGRVEIDDRERFVAFGGSGSETQIDEVAFIPKVGFRYEFSQNLIAGYTYAEGFRPGGVDFDLFDPAGTVVEYDSERLRQHEIYAKTRLLEDRLQINGSAFFYTFDDAQVAGAAEGAAGTLGLFGNVPSARGYGLELESALEVVDGVILTAGLGLLSTEITDAGASLSEFEGDDLPRAPEITASGGLRYVSPLGFDASVTVRYIDSITPALGSSAIDSYALLDLAAGYRLTVGNSVDVRIDGFVENVTDKTYVTDTNGAAVVIGRPRTFGISGTIRF